MTTLLFILRREFWHHVDERHSTLRGYLLFEPGHVAACSPSLQPSILCNQMVLESCSMEGMDGLYLASFALDSYVKPLRCLGRRDASACPHGN
jgi:hypothetical protein